MARTIQFKRGTQEQVLTLTRPEGSLAIAMDTKEIYIHDGSTEGGHLATGGGGAWYAEGADFGAIAGNSYICDTDIDGPFSVTLPAEPANGARIEFADGVMAAWDEFNLTILRNGNMIQNLEEDLVCDISGGHVVLVFDSNRNSWVIVTS